MNKIVRKIDKVSTIDEAIMCQKLGVEFIGIAIKDIKSDDNRAISEEEAANLVRTISPTRAVLLVYDIENTDKIVNLVDRINCDYVQPPDNQVFSKDIEESLHKKGVKIIYSRTGISYDDDPSWILSPFLDGDRENIAYYQVDLLHDIENSWEFLKEECPKYPEDLQINDLIELAQEYPLFIGLDYSSENIFEIVNSIRDIKGISMVLGKNDERSDIHCFDFSEVLEVLEKMALR